MSVQVLTDDEFSARLNEGRSFLEGLKAEADARGQLSLAMELAEAEEALRCAVVRWNGSRDRLAPWEFVNAAGAVSVCSWCEQEHGHTPDPRQTHGACTRHAEAWRSELARRRLAILVAERRRAA